ncbi:helix-turn-helix domain-containing protein [Pararhizobium sp. IMCC21322]|uniref:AraC family transcriptional regulator n=1 Tax=Pararhizobium sp. IMCC21322 TaxID=3067903 RepID=UPI0027419DB5|nr:helix-turn-helix domain-containing protein [Pararhizobium sp. IMCC21322]
MTVVLLIGTATLGVVMSAYLFGLIRQQRFVLASSFLAAAFALISVSAALLALHLAYDIPALTQIRATLALLAVPCLYLYFSAIATDSKKLSHRHIIHLVPLFAGALVLTRNTPWLLDFVLLATYLAYALALTVMLRKRDDRFAALGEDAAQTILWLKIVILFLAATFILDLIIFVDLTDGGLLKQSAPLLVSILSIAALVSFALIGALGRPSLFEHVYNYTSEVSAHRQRQAADPTPDQQALAGRVTSLLQQPTILSDENLTITRVARRMAVPTRKVSQAINMVAKCSFSDVLNDHRIDYSKTLMQQEPDKSLLEIMLDAGYATKSNFYNQFSKRTGITPAAYRERLKETTQTS